MKFHDFYTSNAAYRVRIALNLKNIKAEQIIVDLVADEHRVPWFEELNLQRMLPILEDGDVMIAQSLPITEYLEETHPEPALLPVTPPAAPGCEASPNPSSAICIP